MYILVDLFHLVLFIFLCLINIMFNLFSVHMQDIYPELLVKLCVNDAVFMKGNKIALILVV